RVRFEKATRAPNVHFVGFKSRDEIADFYAASDLFLFPSTTDTLGQVVMEAQASGLPAIVSTIGGPKEIVTHDLTGIVAPVEDPRDWIVAINALLADPDRLRTMGEASFHQMKTRTIERSFQDFWRAHLEARRVHLAEHGVTPKGRTGKTPDITPGMALG
ncbi:MAG: glycosyltransferase, partial [Phycisphaerales bacterium]|nr:glycosyltransferase [Phycisphaerales bacterium]